jgi:lipoic acid synthetase
MYHPDWIKVRFSGVHETKRILRYYKVSTVCEEARCPNQGGCFSKNTATFLILGDRCTRNCSFCAVKSAEPLPLDMDEPERVAKASFALGLRFVVITSVTRDDLPDGGAGHFARTIKAIRERDKDMKIEVLTPDFKGDLHLLKTVLEAYPDVFNHNIETVPRLYPVIRPKSDYKRSLKLIRFASRLYPDIKTKSGIMLGLGERKSEVLAVMRDLRDAGCDFFTIGQYLRPQRQNIPVVEYIKPEVFKWYKEKGLEMGFKAVTSSPLTRSSMNAEQMYTLKNPKS